MNKKTVLLLILCLACLVSMLSGCGDKKPDDSQSGSADPVILIQIPSGVYVEELSKRGMLFVSDAGQGLTSFRIEWSGGAYSHARWEMTGAYNSEKNAFLYTDGIYIETEYNDQQQGNDKVVYTHGTGSFTYSGSKVVWLGDNETDRGAVTFVFEKTLEDYNRDTSNPGSPVEIPVASATPAPSGENQPVPVSTPTPAPSAAPSPSPEAQKLPIITKHPTDETVRAGGNCMFIARYENAIWARWHFVSPDGKMDIQYDAINTQFPTLVVLRGEYSDMRLQNIPYELNGWRVYCRYSNNDGYTDTKTALITVQPAPAPTATPAPTEAPAPEPTVEPTPGLGPVVNDWTDTDSIIEATYGAGFNFTPPLEQTIPEGLTLKGYRYQPGILEADYADDQGQVQLIIRKSNSVSGQELHGDFNSYTKTWDHTLKGLVVHCLGNGDTVNTCWFDPGDVHFSISYHMGKEGSGLTLDQINSIVNCMQ